MKLFDARLAFCSLCLVAPLLGLASAGCSDPFVAFDALPLSAGGSSGGGGAEQAGGKAGAQPDVAGSAGLASGGTLPIGGAPLVEPVTDGGDSVGGEANGGAGGETSPPPSSVFDLIDDMEGAFPSLPLRGGRNGAWFTTHDDSYGQLSGAKAVPLLPARDGSHFAASFDGSGYSDWGAQMGVSLRSPAGAYDARGYCGVRFFAKGTPGAWTFLVSDKASVPQGGLCDPNAWDGDSACYRFVGKPLEVTPDWQLFTLRFDELKLVLQPDSARALDASAIYDIIFNFQSDYGSPFQLTVDDVAFIENGSLACQ